MPINQRNAGFISATYQPLKVANAPTIGAATAGDASADVAFTAPANVGGSAITEYYAVSDPDRVTGSGASSPVTVSGLTNGTAYTFSVWALNTYGPSPFSGASESVTPAGPTVLFAGGEAPSVAVNTINFVVTTTTGNFSDFGDLLTNNYRGTAFGSATRSIFCAGSPSVATINFVTPTATSNATDFGDLVTPQKQMGGASSSTRGLIFCGGEGGRVNVIQYVTIATAGNSLDFGDALKPIEDICGFSSPTRGLFAGGSDTDGKTNTIAFVTIATTGNATNFGDLTIARNISPAGISSNTRGIIAGGSSSVNSIDFVTIASAGNATDFGDLAAARTFTAGTGSGVRGLIGGGSPSSNVVQFLTIASAGNTSTFGDLIYTTPAAPCATSNAHGGL
jgi:hypothetical protein